MTIENYVRVGMVAGIVGAIGYAIGQHYEGNARCLKDGIEERFSIDFPGYNRDADGSDPKDEKLWELRSAYMSGELLDHSMHVTPAEQADAIQKSRKARGIVESSCENNNKSY